MGAGVPVHSGINAPGKHDTGDTDGPGTNGVLGTPEGGGLPVGSRHAGSIEPGVHDGSVGGSGSGGGCAGATAAAVASGVELAVANASPASAASSGTSTASVHDMRRRDRRRGGSGGRVVGVGMAHTPPTMPLRISTTSGASAASPKPMPAALNAPLAFSTSPGSPEAIR